MKLTKAAEIHELNINEAGKRMPADTLKALKLGKEALARIILCRLKGDIIDLTLLPGETPEENEDPSFRHDARNHHSRSPRK